MKKRGIDREIQKVLRRDACSGCGACTLLDSGLTMQLDADGFSRPTRVTPPGRDTASPSTFRTICPGVGITRPGRAGRRRHPVFGDYLEAWSAWASSPEIRYLGSSGGALTALSEWLLASGHSTKVTGATAGPDPRRSTPVTITTREEALRAAGSRYSPVPAAGNPDVRDGCAAVVGKPCDIAAVRAMSLEAGGGETPILLSFFCAGTPSALATDALTIKAGLPADSVPDELRYRGHGWPGDFTVVQSGQSSSLNYRESWGKSLGRSLQWRCKVCVDSTGEQADIVAADFWLSDEDGYPVFDEADGISALIARTTRGLAIVRAAIEAGVLQTNPLELESLAEVQPSQVQRRTNLLARMLGSLAAGRIPPRYRGYLAELMGSLLRHPQEAFRVARATGSRVRAERARRADHL